LINIFLPLLQWQALNHHKCQWYQYDLR
jgi:hypothetical protein